MPIRWDALKQHRREAPWLVLDLFVLALITVNLVLLLADTLLLNSGAGLLLGRFQPELITAWRTEWHHPVWLYDTILTGFLIGELALRWAVAVYGRTYHRWFFYPFIHWYDVLGCLPGLQALRLFRLVTVFYRLNRMGLLLIGGGLIITARKYYNIVLEEISDRIVLNVLEGVRQEIRAGGPVSEQVRERILDPHRDTLVQWTAAGLSQIAAQGFQPHRQQLAEYMRQVTAEAIHHNPNWRSLRRKLPLVGPAVEEELHEITADLVNSLTTRILSDLGRPGNPAMQVVSEALYTNLTRPDPQMALTLEAIALEILDLLKSQIAVQHWKREEHRENS